MSKEVNYKQGMTTVWSDGEKLVVRNNSGKKHVQTNVDHIFGLGTWDKVYDVKYTEEEIRSRTNPMNKHYELVSPYIPTRVLEDLGMKKYSDYTEKQEESNPVDFVKKYFKDIKT